MKKTMEMGEKNVDSGIQEMTIYKEIIIDSFDGISFYRNPHSLKELGENLPLKIVDNKKAIIDNSSTVFSRKNS